MFNNKNKNNLCSLLMIFGAIYYLLAEFISIANSLDSFKSYFTHTISDLGVPFNIYPFSQNAGLMKSAFLVNGIIFFICYFYLVANNLPSKKSLLTTLSFLASVGVVLVGLFHCRSYLITLHFMGTFLTFLFGNILISLTGKYCNNTLKPYKVLCNSLSLLGLISALLILFKAPFKFVPLLERLTIYPIIIFEIVTGILIIALTNKNKNFI